MKSQKILNHPNHSNSDYDHLKNKGYTNKEIIAIWDKDQEAGKNPVGHKQAPDLLSMFK